MFVGEQSAKALRLLHTHTYPISFIYKDKDSRVGVPKKWYISECCYGCVVVVHRKSRSNVQGVCIYYGVCYKNIDREYICSFVFIVGIHWVFIVVVVGFWVAEWMMFVWGGYFYSLIITLLICTLNLMYLYNRNICRCEFYIGISNNRRR